MTNLARQTGFLVGLVIGALSVLATVAFGVVDDFPGTIVFLLPGLLLSMKIANSHALLFVWVAGFGNFCFWFLLCWLLGTLTGRIVSARAHSDAP